MITLLLKENDIPELTSFSGNIDADSIKPYIFLSQKNDIKRVLGLELYTKILADYETDTLAGEYKIIYDDYVVDMLVFFSCSAYMAFGGYKTTNNGIHKVSFDSAVVVDYKEVAILISRYQQLATNAETAFYNYIKTISLPEYPQTTDDLDQNKIIQLY